MKHRTNNDHTQPRRHGWTWAVVALCALLLAAGCAHPSADTTVPPTSLPTSTAVPVSSWQPALRTVCQAAPLGVIAALAPGAAGLYAATALGPGCQWVTSDDSVRIQVHAPTTWTYASYRQLDPQVTTPVTVAGVSGVVGVIEQACAVLLDVSGAPLEVDVTTPRGPAASCPNAQSIAAAVLTDLRNDR